MTSSDELALAERLIGYDSSRPEGVRDALAFVEGWLEGQGIRHRAIEVDGQVALVAEVGTGPRTVTWSAHIDVVPGEPRQFEPQLVDGRLYGRGAYDMKGALAAMLAALADLSARDGAGVRTELVIVPDEESEARSHELKATAQLARAGHIGEFVICGEPTDLDVGVQAKGALVLRLDVRGRSAHGSTPWLGENAIVKAVDLAERVSRLPFAAERAPLLAAGPTVNLGRIHGGDAINRVPDRCTVDLDVRFLPGQRPESVLAEVQELWPGTECIYRVAAVDVDPRHPHVLALLDALGASGHDAAAIARDGASDVAVFQEMGIPGVEFGPAGEGHHGPAEYVDVASLRTYRRALVEYTARAAALGG